MNDVVADQARRTVEAALRIANERAVLLKEIRSLLVSGDEREAVVLMRRYCGLPAPNTK